MPVLLPGYKRRHDCRPTAFSLCRLLFFLPCVILFLQGAKTTRVLGTEEKADVQFDLSGTYRRMFCDSAFVVDSEALYGGKSQGRKFVQMRIGMDQMAALRSHHSEKLMLNHWPSLPADGLFYFRQRVWWDKLVSSQHPLVFQTNAQTS